MRREFRYLIALAFTFTFFIAFASDVTAKCVFCKPSAGFLPMALLKEAAASVHLCGVTIVCFPLRAVRGEIARCVLQKHQAS